MLLQSWILKSNITSTKSVYSLYMYENCAKIIHWHPDLFFFLAFCYYYPVLDLSLKMVNGALIIHWKFISCFNWILLNILVAQSCSDIGDVSLNPHINAH